MAEPVQSSVGRGGETPVKVAIVGTGYAEKHARHYRAREDVEVAGVCARGLASAQRFAREHGIEHATSSWDELLSLPNLTAVSIASPPATHLELTRAAAERGLHLLCEKPLATNADEAAEMLELAERAGVIHATNFDFRISPGVAKLHELLKAGYVGELRHASIHWMGCDHADPAAPWTWRHDRSLAGAGVLGDLHHALDYVRWLFGDVARLVADAQVVVPERHSAADGAPRRSDTEDVASFIAVTTDGKPVSAQLSRCGTGGGHVVVEAFGSAGMLRMTMPNASTRLSTMLTGARAGAVEDLFSGDASGPVPTTQDLFVDAIRARLAGRLEPPVSSSFEDGLAAVRMMDAVLESSATRTWVELA